MNVHNVIGMVPFINLLRQVKICIGVCAKSHIRIHPAHAQSLIRVFALH